MLDDEGRLPRWLRDTAIAIASGALVFFWLWPTDRGVTTATKWETVWTALGAIATFGAVAVSLAVSARAKKDASEVALQSIEHEHQLQRERMQEAERSARAIVAHSISAELLAWSEYAHEQGQYMRMGRRAGAYRMPPYIFRLFAMPGMAGQIGLLGESHAFYVLQIYGEIGSILADLDARRDDMFILPLERAYVTGDTTTIVDRIEDTGKRAGKLAAEIYGQSPPVVHDA
jgi:hypothetical protein